MKKQNSTILLIVVIILAAAAVLFVYPHAKIFGVGVYPLGFGAKYMPWRLGLDLIGGTQLIYEIDTSQMASDDEKSVLNGLRDIMEKRVNVFGVSEPQVFISKTGNKNRVVVELAGIKDVKEAVAQIGRTAMLDFRETIEMPSDNTATSTDLENKTQFIKTDLTGRYLKKSYISTDAAAGQPQIGLQFSSEGAKIFEDLTAKNIGKPLAIFIDDQLVEMPVVKDKISGGQAVITGQFTTDEATKLVSLFNAGALPAPVNLVSQQTIGASLGSESLQKSLWAGTLGLSVIIVFMLAYYHRLGLFAVVALLMYVPLTLAVLKGISTTMTLSGIAGFVLSIGMAVDANVLIFERSKEEIKKGLSKFAAIEEGFRRAWPSIRDSNISTIISALILYAFTTSFVKGFALTLLIGVLVSMFSAITITRTLLRVFVKMTND